MSKAKKIQIRNSTAEFIIFTKQAGKENVDVMLSDDNVWLTQTMIAKLYDKGRTTISEHLKNIFESGELVKNVVCRNFRHTTQHGAIEDKTQEKMVKYYNLEVVISLGYRVNSPQAIQFRQWATSVLKDFTIRGYVIDRKRMENGTFFNEDYFERLLEEIREIRLSERRFYQKITDIYSMAMDYDKNSPTTKDFFAKVQNKMHYAIHKNTAAELIYRRADHKKENMGLTFWEKSPKGKIFKCDVSIAKNYLSESELESLGRIVNGYLDFAEEYAKQHIPLTMQDWAKHLDLILQANGKELLQHAGKITAEIAKQKAENEYEKYRHEQDKKYISDFDQEIKKLKKERPSSPW